MIRQFYLDNKSIIHLVGPWIALFLLLNVSYYEDGDVNALSRYAAMRAMSMDATFQIDDYKGWSMDWSQGPNGHYYSNKAPGPILLGYPIFWIIDHVKLLADRSFGENYRDKLTLGYEHKVGIPLLLQMIPLCILVFLVARYLLQQGVSKIAVVFTSMALLFGNTSALLMTTWFGHGFAACMTLAFLLSVFHKKWKLSGLLLGLAILSDYSVSLFIPGMLIYLAATSQLNRQVMGHIVIGGILPGILWLWYHWTNFGGPLSLPNMYQNPKFGGDSLGTQFHLIPIPYYMLMLIVGDERGVLYTQPWVLVLLATGAWYLYRKGMDRSQKWLFIALVMTFTSLLVMNAAFTGWHGGSTPGPRYLSVIMPFFAVFCGLIYDKTSPIIRHTLWLALGLSIAFGGLVYATTILAYEYFTIWTWLLDYLVKYDKGSFLRLFIYFGSFALVSFYVFRRQLRPSLEDIYT